jgi:hypothetical protein
VVQLHPQALGTHFSRILRHELVTVGQDPRSRWVCNIKIDLSETVFKDMNWIQVAYHRVQWLAVDYVIMGFWVQYTTGNFLTI